MKRFAKIILQYYLFIFAKLALLLRQPFIIAVAGTTNKTFTKQAIESFLRARGETLAVPSFNTEIGLPLAILGLPSGYNSYQRWLAIMFLAPFKAFYVKLPKIVVFEFGADRPGDLSYLISLAPPKVVVIASITQRYLEQFGGIDKAAHEYQILVKSVGKNGLIVLNNDIPEVKHLQIVSRAKTVFFGISEENISADENSWLISNFKITEQGIVGNLVNNDIKKDFALNRFGKHNALAYAAASAVIDDLIL
ncbi:MAG: Mur ligase family protein [Candidatus Falkowbacteria bacterium]|nr:Mur ligase family protein [Candidatus Falkowbacteria bacterium]